MARHAIDRGRRVRVWEVWNEANTSWIKPCPGDRFEDGFKEIYSKALGLETGKASRDAKPVALLQAYLKLYAATARGVKRADPEALVGGPALAGGPFETAEQGHARNGKAFARGLMLYCTRESFPSTS